MVHKHVQIPVIQKNFNAILYVPKQDKLAFHKSINITTTVFDNTSEHASYVKTFDSNSQHGSNLKLFDVRKTPFSHQDPKKPLLNSKEILQNGTTPKQGKISMAVNQHQYDEVPEPQLQNFIVTLQNLPQNNTARPVKSVAVLRNDVLNGNIIPDQFSDKNLINVRHVQILVNEFAPAERALQQVISTHFVNSTCTVLETQFHHLIQHREEPKIVKEIVHDMEDILNREKANIAPYTVYEQQEIGKSHHFMDIFKKYLN